VQKSNFTPEKVRQKIRNLGQEVQIFREKCIFAATFLGEKCIY